MVEFEPNFNPRKEDLKPRDSFLNKKSGIAAAREEKKNEKSEYTDPKWFSGPEYIPREHSIDVKGFGKNPNLKKWSKRIKAHIH